MITRRQLLVSALCAVPALATTRSFADNWPSRPVRMTLGFPPGQASDVLARVYATEMHEGLGQPVVVENRPGAGATLAVSLIAQAAPDGYNILFSSSGPLAVAPHLYTNLDYDPIKDLDPVAIVGQSPLVLLVRPDFPAKTVKELVALAEKKKGQLNYGSGGNGVTNHLAMEMFINSSGAEMVHIPYKGAAAALTDLVGGQIQMMFETVSAALPLLRDGKLRAVAVSSQERYPDLPDVPTIAETYAGFEATPWAGIFVPKGTPAHIVQKISAQLDKVTQNAALVERIRGLGFLPSPHSSPEKARAYMQAEHQKWGETIRKSNISLG